MRLEDIKVENCSPHELPYIFVGEILKIDDGIAGPIDFGKGAFLEKASGGYLDNIRNIVCPISIVSSHYNRPIYELKKIPQENGYKVQNLENPKDWNYWIVRHSDKYIDTNLESALELSDVGLTPYLTKSGPTSLVTSRLELGIHLHETHNFHETVFKQEDINNIKEIRCLLDTFNNEKFTYIQKAVKDFSDLRTIPNRSTLKFLAMFSIIESLLTNNDRNSTIATQLKTKIPLLNNRFSKKIDFNEHFKGSNTLTESKFIEKMYDYRSRIAHGDDVDFNKDHKVIMSKDTATKFLKLLLKRIIVHALKEPQLIMDLKKC